MKCFIGWVMNRMKPESRKAMTVGVTCIATYLANYYLRNILSVLTPRLLDTGEFTVELIGVLSSTYMIFYAAGQLVNGFLGDFLSPKKIVTAGITVAGIASIVFPFIGTEIFQILCFAVLGFGLSMVRGPLMKIISENTTPNHARTICVFFSFASFAGPLVASAFAMLNNWHFVFIVAGAVAVAFAVAAYVILTVMEKRKQICYKTASSQSVSSILSVFKIEKFAFYMVIASLVEIGAASISFWIPTFLTENLLFSKNTANVIFTIISVIRSIIPFAALAIFRATKERDIAMMRASFIIATVMFACILIAPNKWFALVLLLLALMAMSCSSALLWSIYIPGLGSTGRVSSVNGVLDCTGYIAAATANMVFAGIMGMSSAGWNTVFILWSAIALVGVIATFFVKKHQEDA